MKYIIIIILIINSAFSVDIDNKLFETIQNTDYLKEIEKQINESEKSKSKNIETINIEKKHLKRLMEAYNLKITIKDFDTTVLSQEKNIVDSVLKLLLYTSEIKIKERKQNELLNDIQNKLSLLKKRIENIIEEDKSLVLSYQLQYAYYKIQKNHIQNRLNLLVLARNSVLTSILNVFNKNIVLQPIQIEENMIILDERINKLIVQKTSFEIEVEKEIINENTKNKELLEKEITKIEILIENILIEKVNLLNRIVISRLIEKRDKEYLETQEKIDSLLEIVKDDLLEIYIIQNIIIKDIAKKILGNNKIFFGKTISQTKDYYEQFKGLFTSTLFVFNEQAISLLSILKSLILIITGFVIGLLYKRWIHKVYLKWPNMSQMSLKLTSNVGFYLIILITIMISMSSLGIDMSSISLIAGALSIGIGFGLQTVVSNFIAGIILMFERTIRIGDIIEINDILQGIVTDIRIRSTTIKTFDNIDIVIPNSSFIQNNVINWTLDDSTRRLHIPFGVAYGTKVEQVKKAILVDLKISDLTYLRDVKEKEPEIRMENMNTSSVDFELLVWVKANDKFKPNSLRSDFLILIYNSLYKHNIEIPFPQLDLHLKKDKDEQNA